MGGPIRKNKTFFYAAVQRTDFLSGYANRAIVTTASPAGLGDVRTPQTIAEVANQWLQSGAQDNPQFAANFLAALRRFPADQIPGLESQFFTSTTNAAQPLFRQLTAADIHPVAINILNVKRNGKFLLPSVTSANRLLPGNATFGREQEQVNAFPTFFNSWSGSLSLEHNFSSSDRLRLNYIKSQQYVEEAFPWANSSVSPTLGLTPGYVTSLSHIHTFGPHWTNELRGGFFELFNTRISKFRDIFNSTLGINNPLEKAVGGLASLMPTVDIVTQRSGAGIGNAWDFYDRQRNAYATDLVTSVRGSHSFQFGGEARRTNLKGEYMARTNGDLDYDNWILFFTGHGASGGGSDLDQGDTRRDYNMFDVGLFAQDEWRVRKGLTLTLGARWDYYGWPVETAGRIGTYYNQADAARAGIEPGYYIAKDHLIFKPGFNPLQMGLAVSPYVQPLNLSQVHKAQRDSIFEPDRNNIAPRIGFAWKPGFSERLVLRGGYGIYFERPSGSFKTDLQLSSPFFIYQNVPAPLDMANPYPHLNINPFTIPLQVQIARDANGTPTWRRFDGTAFPATEPFAAKNFTFIDPFIKTPYVQQWTFNVQFEPVRGNLLDIRYVGTRGVGLMAKVNLAQPLDPQSHAGQRLHRYTHAHRRVDQSGFLRARRIPGTRKAERLSRAIQLGRVHLSRPAGQLSPPLPTPFAGQRRLHVVQNARQHFLRRRPGGARRAQFAQQPRPRGFRSRASLQRGLRLRTPDTASAMARRKNAARRLVAQRDGDRAERHPLLHRRLVHVERILRAGRSRARRFRSRPHHRQHAAKTAACRAAWISTSIQRRSSIPRITGETRDGTSFSGPRKSRWISRSPKPCT